MRAYYWWGFGGAIAVLAIIGIVYLMMGSRSDLPSTFDESELPALPGESEEIEFPPLPPVPGSASVEEVQKSPPSVAESTNSRGADAAFVGTWKVYSQRLFYDEGGGGTALSASSGTATTQTLKLKNDGMYEYGDSKGAWKVSALATEDWKSWGIESFGPSQKITLEGWNKGIASGPIEEESGAVNFVWVLYKTGPPTTSKPGTVHMKFGH